MHGAAAANRSERSQRLRRKDMLNAARREDGGEAERLRLVAN